jgi:hypothetical protein
MVFLAYSAAPSLWPSGTGVTVSTSVTTWLGEGGTSATEDFDCQKAII